MTLEATIEAILFWKAEPITIARLSTLAKASKEEVSSALDALTESLSGRGLALIRSGDEVELRTAPEASAVIESLTKDELMRDLGKAGLETLSIILYRHPIKRSEIDYIRGVNSSFILRNLLMRGLIERLVEKEGEAGKGRGFSYRPTIELLSHLGVSRVEDLPDHARIVAELAAFENAAREDDAPATPPQEETSAQTPQSA